jgi:ribosomal protein L11 methyltransferase
MSDNIYRGTIGNFYINDAFDAMDILFDDGYMSVSCLDISGNSWQLEVLSDKPIVWDKIAPLLKKYNCFLINSGKIEKVNWLRRNLKNFKAIEVGNFHIFGRHLRGKPTPLDKIRLEISAATAFGTGEHPTTKCCLRACQTFFDPREHRYALDLGSGSSILGIALAKLGCRHVTACDIDPEAVRISLENVGINRVAHRVHVFQNKNYEFNYGRYNFIIANILTEPLVSMSESIVGCLAENGIFVASGFITEDKSVSRQYTSLGLVVKYIYQCDGWTTVVFKN